MRQLSDQQCVALLARHDIKPSASVSAQMLYAALRDAYHLGLHAEVMKTRVREKPHGNT